MEQKKIVNAGTIASDYLMESDKALITPRSDEGPLTHNGRHYVSNVDELQCNVLRYISTNHGEKYATARMVNEVVATISIARNLKDGPRPHYVDRPSGQPESILGLQNCNLHIGSDGSIKTLDHPPEVLTTHVTDYPFDASGKICSVFDGIMDWFTCRDQKLKKYILMFIAAILCRFLDLQKIPIFLGEGRNGKGVLFNTIQRLVGKHGVSAVSMDQLGSRFNSDLRDKWVNIDADLSETSKTKEGMLKKLVDRSQIRFEEKYKNPTTSPCYAMFLFAANQIVQFRDRTEGMGRRVVYIPCNATVEDGDVVQNLESTFWMPGVLNQVLREIPELVRDGLVDCPAVNKLTAKARLEANPAYMFLEERICLESGSKLTKSEVYKNYKDWCESGGYKYLKQQNFGRELARYFSESIRANEVKLEGKLNGKHLRQNAYVGLGFKVDRVPDDSNLPSSPQGNNQKTATPEELKKQMEEVRGLGKW